MTLRRVSSVLCAFALLTWGPAAAGEIVDATGRTITVAEPVGRIAPAPSL